MSQRRVIVGTDYLGRPVSRWTDPETVSAYRHMEHATEMAVVRRQATPAELALVLTRDTAPGYLKAKPIVETQPTGSWEGMRMTDERDERMRASRARGVERSHPVVRAPGWVATPQSAAQIAHRDARAARVMAAMALHGDDPKAAAGALGMTHQAVAQIVKHVRLRAGAAA